MTSKLVFFMAATTPEEKSACWNVDFDDTPRSRFFHFFKLSLSPERLLIKMEMNILPYLLT